MRTSPQWRRTSYHAASPGRVDRGGGRLERRAAVFANMLTRFPERFGALFCTIPLIDMPDTPSSWLARAGSRKYATRRRGRLA